MNGFTTKAIHGGTAQPRDPHGALRTPLYQSVAFEFEQSRDLELAFEGRKPAHAYSRITNPTVGDFEQRIGDLSGAQGVIAVSSGMAAIANVMLAIGHAGANVVTSPFLFGHTLSLFSSTLAEWGLSVRYVDMTDPASIESAIDENTCAVFAEVITNPQLEVADIGPIARLTAGRGVPLIVDGTCTTPYLFRSRDFGVAVEVVSSTKFISGGATSVGGLIIDNGIHDWSRNPKLANDAKRFGPFALQTRLRREVYRNLGACMSPHTAYLQTLGLETLALRIDRACANTLGLARFLQNHSKTKAVNYPGLPESPFHQTARHQFAERYGAILTFELPDKEACFRLMDALTIIRRATNLNDNKTLIIHPASTIFCDYSPRQRESMQVTDGLIRLAVGIEDVQDLIDDLEKGLAAL